MTTTDVPDLIETSGREDMDLGDRLGLLAHDVELLESAFLSRSGATIHDFRNLLGIARNEAILARQHPDRVDRGWLARVECRVLAWKRGGREEHRRIVREQNERILTRAPAR